MTTLTSIKRILVALNLPSQIGDFIIFAKAIYKAMVSSVHFTASASKISKLNADILALDMAETACNTKLPTGSVEARNACVELVKADLRSLCKDVQDVADSDPANAQAIIVSAGMSVKKMPSHAKQQNTAKDGAEEGTVELTAEGAGAHEWRMSTDDETWSLLPASFTSKTTVNRLTSGLVYYFQNRRLMSNDEKTDWSQSVKIRVR